MPRLEIVSYLSEYHDEAAARLAAAGPEFSIRMHFEPSRPYPDRRRLIEEGTAEVIWMCGFLTRRLIDRGRLAADIVAAPVFIGEAEPVYRTLVVVPVDSPARNMSDLGGTRLVINETESWSGNHALAVHLMAEGMALPFFRAAFESGSHSASLQAILHDEAECTALDSSVWSLLPLDVRDRLRVVERTRDWPAPPVSVTRRLDGDRRRGVLQALTTTDADRAAERFIPIDRSAYDEMARHRSVPLGARLGPARTG